MSKVIEKIIPTNSDKETNSNLEKEIIIETGAWAKQSHGAIVYKCGDLVLLATVCAEKEAKADQSFFPLTVDYREKFYAAGRIPGGYFKRENRPAEHETLISRIIDRPCRPLFPNGYFCEVQLLITVLSYDINISVEGHAITAASAALMASDIPWNGPIAGVLVARVDGVFIADPNMELREKSDLDLLVAGSADAITMIEGSANEFTNDEMLAALEFAHKSIKHKLEIQINLAKTLNIKKRVVPISLPDPKLIKEINDYAFDKIVQANQTKDKIEREDKINLINKETVEFFEKKFKELNKENNLENNNIKTNLNFVKEELHNLEYIAVREQIFEKGLRYDGRKTDEIRNISVEIDVLPSAHGSAVFTRGQTQSLGVVTLGTKLDNQRYDSLEGQKHKNFMLHYNFPPFSTGEVKRQSGPGRREIGHGNLAYRSLKGVLPNEESFPYVIRIVSEILESNGSSSMASVCSGSLALMTAGVPIKAAVAGIAMGMVSKDNTNFAILSDIAGLEDHFGDMDLKVAGTQKGITAFQLDLKLTGINIDTLKVALEQAKLGRLHILNEMNKVCDKSRENIPDGAPRITSLKIEQSRIGELIGPGGKIIRDIIEKSGAEVNVDDDGTVTIASNSKDNNNKAKQMIDDLFRELKVGDHFEAKVVRIVDFGAFLEMLPGKEGLLHVSKMAKERVENVREIYKEGDIIPIKIFGIDKAGRIDLCHRDLDENTLKEKESMGRSGGGGGGAGGRGRSNTRENGGRNYNRSSSSSSFSSSDRDSRHRDSRPKDNNYDRPNRSNNSDTGNRSRYDRNDRNDRNDRSDRNKSPNSYSQNNNDVNGNKFESPKKESLEKRIRRRLFSGRDRGDND